MEGKPYPLGVSYSENTGRYNFAIYSKHATAVKLLLYKRNNDDDVEVVKSVVLNFLVHKSQRIWHYTLHKDEIVTLDASLYAYQMEGPVATGIYDHAHSFDGKKTLLDPFARSVYFPKHYNRQASCLPGSNDGKGPLGVIDTVFEFEWEGYEKPFVHQPQTQPYDPAQLIIYELHVRHFTMADGGISAALRGTYKGLVQKIPYLLELGVTAVELMPIFQYDPQEYSETNSFHWGYMPLNFFSPHGGYASDQSINGPLHEFAFMVREMHKVGIAVILDVVYNHTSEGGHGGPHYGFKGIDNSTYYMTGQKQENDPIDIPYSYSNFSGTGNTLHCANVHVQNLILESLRYWVQVMKVDGFRFDIASVFARDSKGHLNSDSPIFASITNDPDLSGTILIAEPWGPDYLADLFHSSYLFGKLFPGLSWRQWNDKYRMQMKRFIKSDKNLVGEVMSRLYGSCDHFPDEKFYANHSFQSINYLLSHDGLTMYDNVSYTRTEHQSWDCDGDERLRIRQMKNMITLLMLSNGTPMFRAGDEFCQTQFGEDNPYNLDDARVWLNWDRRTHFDEVFRFFKACIAFRKRHPSIGRSRFWREDIKWYGNNGGYDLTPESRTLAFTLTGKNDVQALADKDIYVMINFYWHGVSFKFQEGDSWYRVVNTGIEGPMDCIDESAERIVDDRYFLGPRSIAVFVKN